MTNSLIYSLLSTVRIVKSRMDGLHMQLQISNISKSSRINAEKEWNNEVLWLSTGGLMLLYQGW
jgi:hypothetical protein